MTDTTSVLVVANETLVGTELVEAVRRRAERGAIRVTVVAPVTQPREGYVVYRDSRRAAAGRRLERTLRALRAAGIPAHGGVFDDEPLAAVKDVLASEKIDEIIVSTHPEAKSGWLRKNLVDEIRKVAGERPVEHVVSDVVSRAGANVLVLANETVLGEPLLDRIRARAKESDASFLIVCPQSDPSRGEHPEAEQPTPIRALDPALRGPRRPRADCTARSVRSGDGGDRGRAHRRDHRFDVPWRALGVAPAGSRRAVALGERPSRRPCHRRVTGGGGRMSNARLRLAFAAETTFPPRAPFFLKTWGTSRFPTPFPAHGPEAGP